MAVEDRFHGAKNALTFNYAFMNTVAQEIGIDKAASLLTKSDVAMGAQQGRVIKEKAGIGECDAKTAYSVVKNSTEEGLGIIFEATATNSQKATFRVGRCAVYEAARMVGMDAETIEALCRAGALRFMDSMVKQFNPNLNYRLTKFRSGPDDSCEEEIVLG